MGAVFDGIGTAVHMQQQSGLRHLEGSLHHLRTSGMLFKRHPEQLCVDKNRQAVYRGHRVSVCRQSLSSDWPVVCCCRFGPCWHLGESSCCCPHLEDAPDSLDVLRGILHLPQHHAARKQQAQQNGGLHVALRVVLCVCRFVGRMFTRNVSWCCQTSLHPSRKPKQAEPQQQSNFSTAVLSRHDGRMQKLEKYADEGCTRTSACGCFPTPHGQQCCCWQGHHKSPEGSY